MAANLITEHGFLKLKKELDDRMGNTRKDIADKLNEAKAIGDLSENAAYIAACEEYKMNEVRIKKLKDLIPTLRVAPDKGGDARIDIGDTVRIKDTETGELQDYNIVGVGEGDPVSSRVSVDSKVGAALVHKRIGQKVKIKLMAGEREYEIIEVD